MEERYRTAPRWEVRGGGRRKAGREDLTLRLLFRVYGPGLCPVKEEGWMGPCTCPPVCHSSLCCGPASRQASENMVGRASPAERADSSRTAPASPVHSTPHSSRSPHQLLSWSCMNSRQLCTSSLVQGILVGLLQERASLGWGQPPPPPRGNVWQEKPLEAAA